MDDFVNGLKRVVENDKQQISIFENEIKEILESDDFDKEFKIKWRKILISDINKSLEKTLMLIKSVEGRKLQ